MGTHVLMMPNCRGAGLKCQIAEGLPRHGFIYCDDSRVYVPRGKFQVVRTLGKCLEHHIIETGEMSKC